MELTGIGLYTLPEAGRLTGARTVEIKRWLFGYSYLRGEDRQRRHSAPLWRPQIQGYDLPAIGFHDLMELRFVREFVKHGVQLVVVRAAAAAARELFGTEYPFTTQRFKTDGKTIFHDAVREHGNLLDLQRRQFTFDEVIRPSLYAGIEFKNDGSASRWYPMHASRSIVVDPEIAFGKPTVADYGIPTATLYAEYQAEKKKSRVARLFDIPVAAVDAAVRFEQRRAV